MFQVSVSSIWNKIYTPIEPKTSENWTFVCTIQNSMYFIQKTKMAINLSHGWMKFMQEMTTLPSLNGCYTQLHTKDTKMITNTVSPPFRLGSDDNYYHR